MSELGKYNTSNALGLATQTLNAVGTGNYTGVTNTLTNGLVSLIQGQALQSGNGTLVGYVMTELNNLQYTNAAAGTQQSFAGSLVNAALNAVSNPTSFATSLVLNAVGTATGLDLNSVSFSENSKTASNGLTVTSTNQFTNGVDDSIKSSISEVGDNSDLTTPDEPGYAASIDPSITNPIDTGSSYTSTASDYDGVSNPYDKVYQLGYKDNGDYTGSDLYVANTIDTDMFARKSPAANRVTGDASLISFLNNINEFGVQLQNNFEVYFSGIQGLLLFVMSFELPGSKQNTTEIYYDGITITIPVNYEHEHEFSMTLMNDAQGYIYSTIKSYIEFDSYNHRTDSGATMTVRALTGLINYNMTGLVDDNGRSGIKYCGSRILCKGVRLTSIGGLTYGQSNNDIQTFTVSGTMIEYSHLPTTLSEER